MLEVLLTIWGIPPYIAHLEDCYHNNIISSNSQSSNEQLIPIMREINRNSVPKKKKKSTKWLYNLVQL